MYFMLHLSVIIINFSLLAAGNNIQVLKTIQATTDSNRSKFISYVHIF